MGVMAQMPVLVVVEAMSISIMVIVIPSLRCLEPLSIINGFPDGAKSSDSSLLMTLPRALYAAHNSLREDAPSTCLEGTRVAILKEILAWSESKNGEKPPVYWLSGLAGIGKSTIAKTVAERAQEKAMLGASFFFSRSDRPLRDPGLGIPTLAFQLAQSDSVFKEVIVAALRQDPTVGQKTLLSQLEVLILTPLLNVNPHRRPILMILDALDEWEEKGAANILRLVFAHLIRIPFLRILITSRPQPHLSSVFNKVPNLAKTVLHDIEASVVQQDIRLYISTELAKIPGELDLAMPADWVTEGERDSLVEKSGKLFVYAATAIRFIGDDRVQDPRGNLKLILNTQSLRQAGWTPYSQLDDLYTGVLRNSLSVYDDPEILERFQIVVGSIVLLRELLSLHSLAKFVRYERYVVEASLRHLHSVIVPPSDIHEAPRIYHPSFLEFITDASRCPMSEFVIVAVLEQELRHAIRCFELMAAHLKRDVAGISDPSLLNREVDGFRRKVREALSPETQYACRYWASHLSHVECGQTRMMEALEVFSLRSILWWFEAMSLLGSVSNAVRSIQEAHRWAVCLFLIDPWCTDF
jgi:NACHT domain